jgi:hypothetical protein
MRELSCANHIIPLGQLEKLPQDWMFKNLSSKKRTQNRKRQRGQVDVEDAKGWQRWQGTETKINNKPCACSAFKL